MTGPPGGGDSCPSGAVGRRRTVLASLGAATVGGLAGCLGSVLDRSVSDDNDDSGGPDRGGDRDGAGTADLSYGPGDPPDLPQVTDPPAAVYVPSHREGMEALGPVTAGDYEVVPMVSYAHPFWQVTGDRVNPVGVSAGDDVHLMVLVRDAATGTVLPVGQGLSWEITRGDDLVDPRSPWRMLSQTMGFHFGGNVPLEGDGEYRVTVELPPPGARRTGALAGRFGAVETASFSFTYDQPLRERLIDGIDYVSEEERGVRGAIEFSVDGGALPEAGDLPGTLQGREDRDGDGDLELPRSHDADVAITVADGFGDGRTGGGTDDAGDGDAGSTDGDGRAPDGDAPYLLVSPRTPYNRAPLVGASLTARVRRDGSEVSSPELVATVDDRAGFHYGASVPDLQPGDGLEIVFGAPPSVVRHQGYETAFLDTEPVEVAVEGW